MSPCTKCGTGWHCRRRAPPATAWWCSALLHRPSTTLVRPRFLPCSICCGRASQTAGRSWVSASAPSCLALALGGAIRPAAAPEFGYVDLVPTGLAAADPVVAGIGAGLPLMLWHDDGIDLPAELQPLAHCHRGRVLAFRAGEWAYGLQFHPGATVDIVRRWAAATWPGAQQPGRARAHRCRNRPASGTRGAVRRQCRRGLAQAGRGLTLGSQEACQHAWHVAVEVVGLRARPCLELRFGSAA